MASISSTAPEKKCCARICPKFSYAVMLLGLIVLALTGIGTFVSGKAPMSGWGLMIHVGAAPLFAIGAMLVSLTWPARCTQQSCAAKLFFWLMLLGSLVVILTGVVPMTPMFGTEGQHLLYLTHRYSAMVLAGIVALHLVSLRGKR
jgi:hypothetical protein